MGHHTVQLYHEEADLAGALATFAAGGLAAGEGVVVIGSQPRWKALTERLRAAGVDTHGAMLRGQLRLFGAKAILSSCMSHGVPDRLAFNEAIGGVLGLMRMRYPVVRVFGELTDLLWAEGRRDAAEAIERFWNKLAESQSFSLLCACPLDSLDGRAYEGALQSVCALHTHLVPTSDCNAFNEAVSSAIREVLEPQLVGMLHSLSAQHRPGTQMPMGQAVMLWLRQHMPRTAEKVLARARARI
ncbi:MAG TPA: MEDS domain-containing protein [Burkholderiales bacterium]|nr:MEDS domain-containing protein [Burkholderiales bacterium]